jgi:hypothetical protein
MLRALAGILVVGFSVALEGSAPEQMNAAITGVVIDSASMRPVYPSRVDIIGTSIFVLGDTLGRFLLAGISPGTYQLRVRGLLHFPDSLTVAVGTDTVRLTPIRLRLDVRTDSILRSLRIVAPGQPR